MYKMSKRIQSPSSINTYKQCPRRYYYQYIEKLPTKPSIYLIRGSIAHKVLEDFYDIEELEEYNIGNQLMKRLLILLKAYWEESHEELHKLGLSDADLKSYFAETQNMLVNWFNQFWARYQDLRESGLDSHEAFKKIIPVREELFESDEKGVRGFIDVIEEEDGSVCLMDYKTSKTDEITPAYKLQLSIYAYLYYLKHNHLPKRVGIYFLRHGTKLLDVTNELIKEAQFEIEQIHMLTDTNDIDEYPQKTSGLCKWSAGKCDFFNKCFKASNLFRR